jgi:hypothetical protein
MTDDVMLAGATRLEHHAPDPNLFEIDNVGPFERE